MRKRRATKTDRLTLAVEPQLRSSLEEEAVRRDLPMSAVIRSLLKSQLAASRSAVDLQAA